MQCAACGYEHREETHMVAKVTYFKTGPKKDKVKEVTKEPLVFKVGDNFNLQLFSNFT